MKKSVLMFVMSALVIFGYSSATPAAPKEDEAMDGADGANVIDLESCRIRTISEPKSKQDFFFTDDAKVVIGPQGQVTLVCHADVPAGSVEPFSQTGFPCRLGSKKNVTFDSHVVWTASGQGTLTCHGSIEG